MRWSCTCLLLFVAGAADAKEALPLSRAFGRALLHHEQPRIDLEDLVQARLRRERALRRLLPSMRIGASFTLFDTEIGLNLDPGNRLVLQRKNAFGARGGVHLTLVDVPKWAALSEAGAGRKAAAALRSHRLSEFLYGIAGKYLEVLAAERRRKIQESALRIAEELLRATERRQAPGSHHQADLSRARIQVIARKRDLQAARAGEEAARTVMRVIVNAPGPFVFSVPNVIAPPSTDPTKLQKLALQQRRDLQAAIHTVAAARKGLAVARGALYPKLTISATSEANQNVALTGRHMNSQTLISFSWNLFDGGGRYTEMKERHSKLRQAILRRALLVRGIVQRVRLAVVELRTVRAALKLSQARLEVATRNHELLQAEYRGGRTSMIRMVDATRELARARLAVFRERLARAFASLELFRAIGAEPTSVLGAPASAAPRRRTTSISRPRGSRKGRPRDGRLKRLPAR